MNIKELSEYLRECAKTYRNLQFNTTPTAGEIRIHANLLEDAALYLRNYERMRVAEVLHNQIERKDSICADLCKQLKAAKTGSDELRSQLEAIRLDRDEWRDRATKYETVHTDGSTTQSDLDVLRALARHLNRVCNSAKL